MRWFCVGQERSLGTTVGSFQVHNVHCLLHQRLAIYKTNGTNAIHFSDSQTLLELIVIAALPVTRLLLQ
jgi:hypothetical protein